MLFTSLVLIFSEIWKLRKIGFYLLFPYPTLDNGMPLTHSVKIEFPITFIVTTMQLYVH